MSTRSKGASTLASKGNATTDTRLEIAKSNLIRVVNGLGPKVYFNVIFFDSSFRKWKKELTRITKKSREEAIQFARQQKASGGTNIYDSLEAAIQTKKVDTIFLLSDGQASQGKFMATEDILREIGRLNSKRRIKIHCIALGGSHSLLEQLAAQSGGRYVQP
jgi:uncharacterized protein with von Willebrand factor type A (vWA) domain